MIVNCSNHLFSHPCNDPLYFLHFCIFYNLLKKLLNLIFKTQIVKKIKYEMAEISETGIRLVHIHCKKHSVDFTVKYMASGCQFFYHYFYGHLPVEHI